MGSFYGQRAGNIKFNAVGYKFNKFNTILAYRYLDYNFDESNRVMEELNVKGPFLGFMFKF